MDPQIDPQISSARWLPANDPCTVCGSRESDLHHTARYPGIAERFEMRRCRGCGLLFNSPRIEDLSLLYRANYYVFHEYETSRYANDFGQVKRHLDPATAFPASPRDVLEVGSARGHLLHILRHLGYNVAGVELSPEAAAAARQRFGIDAFVGTVEHYASRHPRPAHDVVWCNDVIEHVPDPRAFVQACADVLRPGGRLVIDTPSAASINITRGSAHWQGFCPYHVFLFNPQNLPQLCESVGLRVTTVFTYNNQRTPPPTPAQRLRAATRALTAPLGLWRLARKIRDTLANPDGKLKNCPMTSDAITDMLAALPWHSQSPDAQSDIAQNLQGDNLVLHATR